MTVREIEKLLRKAGWYEVRTKGGHKHFGHDDYDYVVTVPQHKGDLARMFHRGSTAATQAGMSTALRLFGLLDRLYNMPSSPSRRAPCIHTRLRRLATKPYETPGLN